MQMLFTDVVLRECDVSRPEHGDWDTIAVKVDSPALGIVWRSDLC